MFIIVVVIGCKSNSKKTANTALDVGREFIRTTLDGNFKEAEPLLLQDSMNVEMFQSYELYYKNLNASIKEGYKKASYNINTFTEQPGDTVAIINYSNSYMKTPMNLKVVKSNNQWAVDFKYTSIDTLAN